MSEKSWGQADSLSCVDCRLYGCPKDKPGPWREGKRQRREHCDCHGFERADPS